MRWYHALTGVGMDEEIKKLFTPGLFLFSPPDSSTAEERLAGAVIVMGDGHPGIFSSSALINLICPWFYFYLLIDTRVLRDPLEGLGVGVRKNVSQPETHIRYMSWVKCRKIAGPEPGGPFPIPLSSLNQGTLPTSLSSMCHPTTPSLLPVAHSSHWSLAKYPKDLGPLVLEKETPWACFLYPPLGWQSTQAQR